MSEWREEDECYEMKFHSSLFTLFKLGKEERLQENELQNTFLSLSYSSLAALHFFSFFLFFFYLRVGALT